jgi:hypothetical protein
MTDQLGFADAFVDPRLGANDKLARIDARIDWSALASQLGGLRAAPTGRRPYPPLKMLKAIYLQALYDLSDPGLEAALLDGCRCAGSAASRRARRRLMRPRSCAFAPMPPRLACSRPASPRSTGSSRTRA